MAKKYYWLKLKEDFFEDDTIEWIEEQPGGERYCLFYLKLCLKSLKTDGVLIRNVGDMLIPYDAKKLAEITKTDVDTVRVAMELFSKIGIVQILENGEIYMSQLQNMVGSETKWAEKKRLQRAKAAENALTDTAETGGEDNVHAKSSKSPREKEKEKEKEIEKEIELTDRQRERVDFLKDLFDSWLVSDFQIFYLSTMVNDKIPYGYDMQERELKIYDYLQNMTNRAKAEGVTYIYRWLLKMIPEVDFE